MITSTFERPSAASADIADIAGGVVFAYLTTTLLAFLFWRGIDLGSLLPVLTVLIYCLATVGAIRLVSAIPAIPQVLAAPGALLVLLLYPILASPLGLFAMIPLVPIAAAAINLRAFRNASGWHVSAALVIGAVLGAAQFHVINAAGYAFVFADIAMVSGGLHRDTAFHSAIANMIASQGAVSTGLHGLTPLNYHVGVHVWVGSIATMADADISLSLAICMQFFVIPLILYLFIRAIHAGQETVAMPLLVIVASLVVFLYAQSDYYSGFLVSESYGLSLTVMFAALPLGIRWLSPETVLTRAVIPEAIMAGVLILAAAVFKVSTGYTLASFFISSMFVLVYRYRPLLALIGIAVAGAVGMSVCLVLYLFMFAPEIMPFHFWHFPSTRQRFWHGFLLYGGGCIVALSVLKIFDFRSLTRIFVVLFVLVVASVPGALFVLVAAGALYFLHPALLTVMTVTLAAICQVASVRLRSSEPLPVLGGLVIAFGLFVVSSFLLPALGQFDRRIDAFHSAVAATEERLADKPFSGPDRPPPLRQIADRLVAMAPDDKRALVYVPPDNVVVWGRQQRTCWEESFAIPALTGLPMIAGVRGEEVGCETTPYHGMFVYNNRAFNRKLDPSELCSEARAIGFDLVLRLDAGVEVTRLDCSVEFPQAADELGARRARDQAGCSLT